MRSTRLHRLILSLYPQEFRDRYGDELDAVVGDCGAGWRVTLDLAVSAARARLSPGISGRRLRMQATAATVFALWAWSALAVAVFARAVDDKPVPGLRSWGWSAYAAGTAVFEVSVAVVMVAGFAFWLRVVVPAARQRDRSTLLLAFLPLPVALVWLGCSALVGLAARHMGGQSTSVNTQGPHGAGAWALLTAYALFTAACVALCTACARRALKRSRLPERMLSASSLVAAAATLALAAVTTCAAVCLARVLMVGGISLRDQVGSVGPVCFLVVATAAAAVSSVRGLTALRTANSR